MPFVKHCFTVLKVSNVIIVPLILAISILLGAEILDAVDEVSNLTCSWNGAIAINCSYANTERSPLTMRKTAAIKCQSETVAS